MALLYFCFAAGVSMAEAQPGPDDPLPAHVIDVPPLQLVSQPRALVLASEQMQQLEQWVRDVTKWQKDADRNLNRRQAGKWVYTVEQRPKPAPPAWLPRACELLSEDAELIKACELLDRWRDDPLAASTRQAAAAALKQREAATKTQWWQHLQVDGLWSTTQSNMSVFGLFGMHVTVEVAGRFQVFVAPGVLLVSVPTTFGSRELMPATDWGVTYRLFNVGRSTVHFNLVHAWLLASQTHVMSPTMTLAGFSVSFRPRPR